MDTTSSAPARPPLSGNAHGHAALILVESLIHGLYERGALTVAEAINIVDRAIEVQADYVEACEDAGYSMRRSYNLLTDIVASLETDVVGAKQRPRLVE